MNVLRQCVPIALVALALGACGDDSEPMNHGVIKIEFQRGASVQPDDQVFAGTAQVTVQLDYENCLQTFYETMTNWRADGIDGAPVFTTGNPDEDIIGFQDFLCQSGEPDAVGCTIVEIVQNLEGATPIPFLAITYSVEGSELEGRFLQFGPIPVAELAMCDGGGAPLMRVRDGGVAVGVDGNGARTWETESFNPPAAVVNDGAAIVIRASRP